MPKCFSAWNAVLNKSVTMHFRHEKQMKHNGTRLMKILIFYSLIMSFSCATCMSTLGFCMNRVTSQYYFVPQSLHKALPSTTLYCKACTKSFPVLLCTTKLAQSPSQYYFVLQSLHKALPSTTLYYKACTKSFPVLLVLQSLHKALPSTTLHYKACTKHLPVLLCTTKLAQSTSSTTLYYKACTKYFPVLLCTTKLAQSTSQYYCVPQSLHKVLPSTTFYYKAFTKPFPVLLCTTKPAQSTSQYYFVLQSLHKLLPSTSLYYKACTKHVPVLLCARQPAWKPSKRRGLAASPIDTAMPQENQRLETRHVGAAKRAFRPILTLSTRYQTGWNVTKCHACHAKRHDNLLGNLRKGEVLQLPP